VAARRLGAALSASRAASGVSLLAMSNRCDRWWRPDELAAFEQGAVGLDDSSVVSLARLYELGGRAIPDAGAFELVLDRSTARDIEVGRSSSARTSDESVLMRLAALLDLCGATLSPASTAVAADVVGVTSGEVRAAITAIDAGTDVRGVAADLEAHIVVPVTGLLVAETPVGSLVAVRPAGRRGRAGHPAAAATSLRAILGRSAV